MSVNLNFFFIPLLAFACLYSCNRGGLGSGRDDTSRSAGVDIKVKKISNSSQTVMGQGQLRIYAAYPLLLTCTNCPTLDIILPFIEAPMETNKYVYTADFDYSLVTQTEVCALTLSVVSKNNSAINAIKNYNVYVCPRQGSTEICDTANAAPSCAHIGR